MYAPGDQGKSSDNQHQQAECASLSPKFAGRTLASYQLRERPATSPRDYARSAMGNYAAARDLLASVRWRNKMQGAENIGRDV
jgi:hypothetical protein